MWRALYLVEIFQSTLSVRRATTRSGLIVSGDVISIHALRKESDLHCDELTFRAELISIHALRKESDSSVARLRNSSYISIHALRKESDHAPPNRSHPQVYFNPRSP